jgi:hypothetical protein
MATSPNYSWPEPDNTDLVKNGALAIRTMGNAIDTTMATMVPKTIIDAKGDLIAGTAADTAARLAVGTNGQVLKANSATATGLEWAADSAGMSNPMTTTGDTIYSSSGSTPARLGIGTTGQVLTVAGGLPSWASAASGGGMTLLSTTTLSGASTTVSSISQSYTQLYAVITGVTYTGASDALAVAPNGVTSGVDSCSTISYGTTVTSVATPNSLFFINYLATTNSDSENACVLVINNYTSTTTNKPMMSYGQSLHSGGNRGTCITWGGDRQNSAISSLTFTINAGGTSFTAGTVLLYGVK